MTVLIKNIALKLQGFFWIFLKIEVFNIIFIFIFKFFSLKWFLISQYKTKVFKKGFIIIINFSIHFCFSIWFSLFVFVKRFHSRIDGLYYCVSLFSFIGQCHQPFLLTCLLAFTVILTLFWQKLSQNLKYGRIEHKTMRLAIL